VKAKTTSLHDACLTVGKAYGMTVGVACSETGSREDAQQCRRDAERFSAGLAALADAYEDAGLAIEVEPLRDAQFLLARVAKGEAHPLARWDEVIGPAFRRVKQLPKLANAKLKKSGAGDSRRLVSPELTAKRAAALGLLKQAMESGVALPCNKQLAESVDLDRSALSPSHWPEWKGKRKRVEDALARLANHPDDEIGPDGEQFPRRTVASNAVRAGDAELGSKRRPR